MRKNALILLCLLTFSVSIYAQNLILSRPDGLISAVCERVVLEAYKRLGVQVKIEKYPAQRSIVLANSGAVNGVVSRIKEIEELYPNLVRIPVAVGVFKGAIFSKELSFSVKNWADLEPYDLGILRGIKFAEIATIGMPVHTVESNAQLFRMLDKGRFDVVVTARAAGLFALKKLGLQDIHILESHLTSENLYHYLHKERLQLVPGITKVLQDMEVEGRIQEIHTQATEELTKPMAVKN